MTTCDKISILIIEDEALWQETLVEDLDSFGFSIAGTADTFESAVSAMSMLKFDIALVDINIQGRESGIELGKLLYSVYNKPYIFLTANTGRTAIEQAIGARPSAYLIKPPHPASLFASIHAAVQNFENNFTPKTIQEQNPDPDYFFVRVGNKFKRISWTDIVYLRAERNYTELFCSCNKVSFYIRSTLLRTLTCMVPEAYRSKFIQVNRSEAVNVSFVTGFSSEEATTAFGSFQVTDMYTKALKTGLNIIV